MMKLGFLTMPESLLAFPSIGLAEIASSLRSKFGSSIEADLFYPCLDYARFIGLEDYMLFQASGLNQWMFRDTAFPDSEDYTEHLRKEFLKKGQSVLKTRTFDTFLEKRQTIPVYLERIIEDYQLLDYDVIGISSAFSQNMASFALAGMIKEKNPLCYIIMGGPNCEFPMGKAIIDNISCIDFVFSGLGIVSFQQFISCLLKNDTVNIHKINGVFSKKNRVITQENAGEQHEFMVKTSADLHPIDTLMDLTYDYDRFLEYYNRFRQDTGFNYKPILLFETSRGCWKRDALPCTFCGLNNPGVCYESMQPELALSYIQNLIERYGKQCLMLSCVDNIIDKRYFKEVIPYLRLPKGLSIMYETSAVLTKDQMQICAEQGINILQPGIESLNTAELKLMQKGISAFTNIQFLKHCIEVGIYPVWSYLYRVPGNTDPTNYEQIAQMLPLLRHLPPPAASVPITVVRYSPFADEKEKYNLDLIPEYGIYNIYPFQKQVIDEIATIYTDITEHAPYKEIAEAYIKDIKIEVVEWMSAFRISTNMPKLYFLEEDIVFDSRFDVDEPDVYDITELQKKILTILENPVTYEQMKALLKNEEESVLYENFDDLMNKQLLFQEEGRYLSLVCEKFYWKREEFDKLLEYIRLTTVSVF